MAKTFNKKLVFVFPDTHIPYQDKRALKCALKAHALLRPGRTVHLGDLIDCAAFSAHGDRSVREIKVYDFLRDELGPANEFIDACQKNTGQYIQIEGNHEYRVERWALRQGITGVSVYDLISPKVHLSKGRKNFKWVPYADVAAPMSYYQITSKLVAVHGWSFAKNAAQVHLDKARSMSMVYGHTHRHQVASTRDPFSKRVIRAFNPGTLSKLQPLYFVGGSPTDWSHGFGLIYCDKNGRDFSEYNITIHNGTCVLPDGRKITA